VFARFKASSLDSGLLTGEGADPNLEATPVLIVAIHLTSFEKDFPALFLGLLTSRFWLDLTSTEGIGGLFSFDSSDTSSLLILITGWHRSVERSLGFFCAFEVRGLLRASLVFFELIAVNNLLLDDLAITKSVVFKLDTITEDNLVDFGTVVVDNVEVNAVVMTALVFALGIVSLEGTADFAELDEDIVEHLDIVVFVFRTFGFSKKVLELAGFTALVLLFGCLPANLFILVSLGITILPRSSRRSSDILRRDFKLRGVAEVLTPPMGVSRRASDILRRDFKLRGVAEGLTPPMGVEWGAIKRGEGMGEPGGLLTRGNGE